jgi:hypothetical protein
MQASDRKPLADALAVSTRLDLCPAFEPSAKIRDRERTPARPGQLPAACWDRRPAPRSDLVWASGAVEWRPQLRFGRPALLTQAAPIRVIPFRW